MVNCHFSNTKVIIIKQQKKSTNTLLFRPKIGRSAEVLPVEIFSTNPAAEELVAGLNVRSGPPFQTFMDVITRVPRPEVFDLLNWDFFLLAEFQNLSMDEVCKFTKN
jgi:hypothetical protein